MAHTVKNLPAMQETSEHTPGLPVTGSVGMRRMVKQNRSMSSITKAKQEHELHHAR